MSKNRREATLIAKRETAFHKTKTPRAAILLDIRKVAHIHPWSLRARAVGSSESWEAQPEGFLGKPRPSVVQTRMPSPFLSPRWKPTSASNLPVLELLWKSRGLGKGKKSLLKFHSQDRVCLCCSKDQHSTRNIHSVSVILRPAFCVPLAKSLWKLFSRNRSSFLRCSCSQQTPNNVFIINNKYFVRAYWMASTCARHWCETVFQKPKVIWH